MWMIRVSEFLRNIKTVVFEKFRQLDESAKRKYGGTGLGLYYARKIAEIMGGKLWFDIQERMADPFSTFRLPIKKLQNLVDL